MLELYKGKVGKQLMNRIHFPLEETCNWLCDLKWVEYVIWRCDHCDSEVLCPCCSWVWTVAVLGPCLAVWLRLFWSVWSVLPSTLQLSFLACTGQVIEIMLVSVLYKTILKLNLRVGIIDFLLFISIVIFLQTSSTTLIHLLRTLSSLFNAVVQEVQ